MSPSNTQLISVPGVEKVNTRNEEIEVEREIELVIINTLSILSLFLYMLINY